jgi:hypothetical protein
MVKDADHIDDLSRVLRLAATVGAWYLVLVVYIGLWPAMWTVAALLPSAVYLYVLSTQLRAIPLVYASGTTSWKRLATGAGLQGVPLWLIGALCFVTLWVSLVLTPPLMLLLPSLAM